MMLLVWTLGDKWSVIWRVKGYNYCQFEHRMSYLRNYFLKYRFITDYKLSFLIRHEFDLPTVVSTELLTSGQAKPRDRGGYGYRTSIPKYASLILSNLKLLLLSP